MERGIWIIFVLLANSKGAAAQLPPEILVDQYLLEADRDLAENNHEGALPELGSSFVCLVGCAETKIVRPNEKSTISELIYRPPPIAQLVDQVKAVFLLLIRVVPRN